MSEKFLPKMQNLGIKPPILGDVGAKVKFCTLIKISLTKVTVGRPMCDECSDL